MHIISVTSFKQWRVEARGLLEAEVPPAGVSFVDGSTAQATLDFTGDTERPRTTRKEPRRRVPRSFLRLAEHVACHHDVARWNALYRVLWRLTHGEPELLQIATDDDVYRVKSWQQQVRRDAHKMKAFVRFRRTKLDDVEWFVAWYRPDYRIARLVAPFFADRFALMNWSIVCPDESMVWDRQQLHLGPGAGREGAPHDDELEQMWLTYYRATFNPARIKLKAMRAEMPVRYWATLPEARIIDQLVAEAPRQVAEMVRQQAESAQKQSQN